MLQLRLGVPRKLDLQRSISSREFVDWCVFLDWFDWHFQSKLDYNFAALAAEVRRTRSTRRIRVEDMLLKFKEGAAKAASKEERTAASKAFWFALAGISSGKKPLPAKVRAATAAFNQTAAKAPMGG